jgi:parallel beta-helix repeat protein
MAGQGQSPLDCRFSVAFAISILLSLLCAPSIMAQACTELEDGMTIAGVVTLCEKEYTLNEGLLINAEGTVLDCNNAVLNGTPDISGISVAANKVKIKNCRINGFGAGIILFSTQNSEIAGSMFTENDFAIYLAQSSSNAIDGNTFKDNRGAVYFNSSSTNMLYNNSFYPTGLIDWEDQINIYCVNGVGNMYYEGETGPVCSEAGSNVNFSSGQQDEASATKPSGQEQQPVSVENASGTTAQGQGTNSEVPMISAGKSTKRIPTRNLNENEAKDFLMLMLEKEGFAGSGLAAQLDTRFSDYLQTKSATTVRKELIFDSQNKKTTVRILIRADRKIKDLYVYENIPKCVAQNVDEIQFSVKPYKVIEADPLVVWHFPEVAKDKEIELDYRVEKEVEIMPQTVIVSEEINITSGSQDKACKEGDLGFSVLVGKCSKFDIRLFLPLLIVPLLVFFYLYFNRYKKKLRKI